MDYPDIGVIWICLYSICFAGSNSLYTYVHDLTKYGSFKWKDQLWEYLCGCRILFHYTLVRQLVYELLLGVLIRWNGLVEWNGGMEYWNSGMSYWAVLN